MNMDINQVKAIIPQNQMEDDIKADILTLCFGEYSADIVLEAVYEDMAHQPETYIYTPDDFKAFIAKYNLEA